MAIDVFVEGFANHFFFPKAIAKHKHPNARKREEIIPSPVLTIWLIVPIKKQQEAAANKKQNIFFVFMTVSPFSFSRILSQDYRKNRTDNRYADARNFYYIA